LSLNTILATAPLATTGFHLKATGTTLGNSLIWDNGTNVGIGNTNTSYTLDVSGTGRFTGALTVGGSVTSQVTANAAFLATSGTTSRIYSQWANTGGNAFFGIESSTGGNLFTGSSAYATILGTDAAKSLQFATNNTIQCTITSAGNVGIGTSSPTYKLQVATGVSGNLCNFSDGVAQTLVIKTDASSLFLDASNGGNMIFQIGSTERMRITSGGDVGIGNTGITNQRVRITGATNDSSTYAFVVCSNNGTDLFNVRNDGQFNTANATNSPYNNPQTGRSVIVANGGTIGYLVSTRESKGNIKSIENVDFINQLNPVSFNYRKKDLDTNTFTDELYDNTTYGFIADEVEKVNKELVFYNEDGTLAGVEYNSMIAILTKAVQEQQIQIQNLQEQNQDLKSRLDKAGL
jgi:hypothetical protein